MFTSVAFTAAFIKTHPTTEKTSAICWFLLLTWHCWMYSKCFEGTLDSVQWILPFTINHCKDCYDNSVTKEWCLRSAINQYHIHLIWPTAFDRVYLIFLGSQKILFIWWLLLNCVNLIYSFTHSSNELANSLSSHLLKTFQAILYLQPPWFSKKNEMHNAHGINALPTIPCVTAT